MQPIGRKPKRLNHTDGHFKKNGVKTGGRKRSWIKRKVKDEELKSN